MDDDATRDHIQQHADAVVRGDLDHVVADFTEDMRPQVPALAQQVLPLPVKSADVLSIEVGDDECVAMIHYTGDTGEVTIRSRWQDEGGRPVIAHAEPAE
jgi:hypothetical protein